MTSRTTLAALASAALLAAGCTSPAPAATVIAFSDVHFDPFFDPSLFATLKASPASEWAGIFAGSQVVGPGTYGGTTNYTLLWRTLGAIHAQRARARAVIFGGDFLVQYFRDRFYLHDQSLDEAAMRAFALKTVTFLVNEIRAAAGPLPVYFTLGNWDVYGTSFALEPNDPFLADTADLFLGGLLAGTADPVAFQATYREGGYYAADLPGSGIVVIGLNTLFLAPQAPAGLDAAIVRELAWLDETLAAVRASGRQAWIVTHVPPGGDLATTGGDMVAGQPVTPAMLLRDGPQAALLAILDAHHDVVAAAFTGHTHMDEYRLVNVPLQGLPGISPIMGNAPAFKTFTLGDGWALQDYLSWVLDLDTPWVPYLPSYGFSSAYGLEGPLDVGQISLVPELLASQPAQVGYRARYGSGHTPAKPITDLNWPVYWCGISFLDLDGLTACINPR